ncbi:MAG TPA: hypothetical protein VNI20_00995 [Fimbriimonadaceae bacterium]|nr:hypothetical protein [Fimbriimonadaceae bacterium]
MDLDTEVKRLRFWVRVQGVAIVVGLVMALSLWFFSRLTAANSQLFINRDANSVDVHGLNDGPFVVTHLAVKGASAGDKRTAVLPQPLACIDSKGVLIEDIDKLDWRDMHGKPAPPPNEDTRISALVLWPRYVEPRTIND